MRREELFKESKKAATRASMSHVDPDLSRALNKINTSKKASIMFQYSHVVTKMTSLLTVKEFVNAMKHEKKQEFRQDDLDFYLQKVLFYLDNATRIKERDYIIKKALELNLVKFENSVYTIQTPQTNVRGQEKEFKRRWLQRKVEEQHREFLDNEIESLRKKYLDLNSKQPQMDTYF